MDFFRGTEPVVIRRHTTTGVDDYGNPTKTSTDLLVRDCLIAIDGTGEPNEVNRNAADAQVTIYLPHGTEVLDDDRFIIRDTEWVKDGEAIQWESPFPSWTLDLVVKLRRRRG